MSTNLTKHINPREKIMKIILPSPEKEANETCDFHFGIPIKNKNYPSCYTYNVLVMLAKRLVKEEKLKSNRHKLDQKLVKRIIK